MRLGALCTLRLCAGVRRFYVRCISLLHDTATMELFYAQAQASVATGLLTPACAVVFQLAALVLQRLYGDYERSVALVDVWPSSRVPYIYGRLD